MNDNSKRPQLTRRAFLGTALAATVSLSNISRSAESWRMKLSTSSVHFRSLSIEQACQIIGRLGFEAIDIWAKFEWGGLCRHLEEVLEDIGPNKFAQILTDNKLKLYAVSMYGDRYERYAEMLGKLGGCVVVRGSDESCKPELLTANMKRLLESLKPQLELAEKYDSYIAVENHGDSLLDSLDSLKAFVDLNKHPRLGIALAPYHLQQRKESVQQAINISGKQLLFFYAWQNAEAVNQLPGLGPTDFKPWLAELARIDYRWYVNPFMHHEPEPDEMEKALAKSRDYLLKCSQQIPPD